MRKSLNTIGSIYILLLPFQLLPIFRGFKSLFSSSASIGNCFFVMLIGLFIYVANERGVVTFEHALMKSGVKLMIALVMLSVLTSVVLYKVLGQLYGENTLSASFAQNIYTLVTAAALFFNQKLFLCMTKEKIKKLLDILCVFEIILAGVQILIVTGAPIIGNLYDSFDLFGVLRDSSYITRINRLCLTSSEPSGMGNIINVLLLPYCLSQIICSDKKKKYITFSIILTVACFFSVSSTVYVAVLVNYVVFTFFAARGKTRIILLVVLLLVSVLFGSVGIGFLSNTGIGQQINYVLIEKTTSNENMSTTYRYSTVINDLNCFLSFPITGVGNGNQGFMYPTTMASDGIGDGMRTNYQTQIALSGQWGVLTGGAFVPAFISGYGVVGIILLLAYLHKGNRHMKQHQTEMGAFYPMYYIGGITFLVMTTVSGGIDGNFIALFLCSLPYMC